MNNLSTYRLMPESAIATSLADYVLPVEQMPEALVKYVQQGYVKGGKVVGVVDEAPDHLNQLLALLRARTKFDFRAYRKKMLARRLARRMGLSHFDNVAEYLAHLREHPEEVKKLARDLLISVTRFFRDPDAFIALETEVIAPLIQAKDTDIPLRVWVPGCATGEEPYSIAMLLLEHQTVAQNARRLQIFATDVDEQSLAIARRGIYPEGISTDVSPERLDRFFRHADESGWQISKQVRETMTFAVQNLLDNRIDGVVITFVDITERKEAADAVIRRLAAVVESSADAIFSTDLDGTITTWNQGAERLYGYRCDEAMGRSVKMFVPEDRTDEWTKVMAAPARGEHVEHLETEHLHKDGQCLAVALTVSPIRDSDGKVVSTSVTGRDITHRKRAEEELRRSEERSRQMADHARDREARLAAILDTAADAIITIDVHGAIQSVNAAAERMFAYAAAEMIGQNAKMLMPAPYREEHDRYLARYMQTREKHVIGIGREVEGRRKDGSTFPVDLAVSEVGHLNLFTYLIAQEAVHNAVKHARCQNIRISVDSDRLLVLRVQDDGIGIPDQPTENHGGLGLRIMRNRAAIIRATLTIEPAKPAGTVVTCALARKNNER